MRSWCAGNIYLWLDVSVAWLGKRNGDHLGRRSLFSAKKKDLLPDQSQEKKRVLHPFQVNRRKGRGPVPADAKLVCLGGGVERYVDIQ